MFVFGSETRTIISDQEGNIRLTSLVTASNRQGNVKSFMIKEFQKKAKVLSQYTEKMTEINP